MADPLTPPPDPVVAPRRTARSSVIRTCAGTRRDGQPCGQAALRGKDLCKEHIVRVEAPSEDRTQGQVSIPRISDLVRLDVSTEEGLLAFRQGLLAHVGSRALDPGAAKQMHEVAQAIYLDARSKKPSAGGMDSLAAQLAKAFVSEKNEAGGGTPG